MENEFNLRGELEKIFDADNEGRTILYWDDLDKILKEFIKELKKYNNECADYPLIKRIVANKINEEIDKLAGSQLIS